MMTMASFLLLVQGPLVWVLWVFQHPRFSKLWVLAPTLFRQIFLLDPSKGKNGVKSSTCTQKKSFQAPILCGFYYKYSLY